MTQGKKIVKGAFYLAITNVLAQFLSLAVNIILGRLLMPQDFGVVALSITFIGSITLFTSVGFGAAIIHYQKATEEEISTLYWINWVLSLLTYVIIFIGADFSANFYEAPDLKNIVRISSLSILLTPFYNIHYKMLERDLEFKTLSRLSFISTFTGSLASVIGAFLDLGAYSLCLQPLVSTITLLIMVTLKNKWRPKLIFQFKPVKKMIWYSIKFKLSNSFAYIERNIDYLILGKIYPSNILGHYSFSYNIMYAPVKRISYLFNDVLFPSFSSYQNDKKKITQAYFKSTQVIALISFPLMTVLAFNAELIIQFAFGDRWAEAVPIIKILCFAGAIQSIGQVGGIIFPSVGKPEVTLYLSIFSSLFTVLAIVIGSFYNILFIAKLLVVSKIATFFLTLFFIYLLIPFKLNDILKYLKGPSITLACLFGMEFVFDALYLQHQQVLKLLAMILLAIATTLFFHMSLLKDIFHLLRSKASKKQ